MHNVYRKWTALLGLVLLTALPACQATTDKSLSGYFERAQEKRPEVIREAEQWKCITKADPNCQLPATEDDAGRQNRSRNSINPATPSLTNKGIMAIGDVIGQKGRADAITFNNGILTVYEGWKPQSVVEFSETSYSYQIGKSSLGFEKAIAGNFFGDVCDSILLYDTNRFKSVLLRNNCLLSARSPNKFKATHVFNKKANNLINTRLVRMVNSFVGEYNGRYIAHAADMDGNGVDDIVFTAIYNNRLTVMPLFANNPRNRADNLEFGQSPTGATVKRQTLTGRLIGTTVRVGNIKGSKLPEIVVYKNSSDIIVDIYSMSGGTFGAPERETHNVTGFSPRNVWLYDANADGYDNLVLSDNQTARWVKY